MDWPLEGRIAMGFPLGFSASALLTWLIAIPLGMSGLTVGLGAVAMAVVLRACMQWTRWREPLGAEIPSARARWRTREPLPVVLLIVPTAIFFIGFFTHALKRLPTGLYAGHGFLAYDWALHLNIAGYLSNAAQLLPPNNPGY